MNFFKKKSADNANVQSVFEEAAAQQQEKVDQLNVGVYEQDGLRTGHNHDFMKDPRFQAAYARGVKAVGIDYHWHWRVHVFLWAFNQATKLNGAFVECGVYKGFMFSASMHYTDWNKLDKSAFLFDTFKGIDETQLLKEEKELGRAEQFKDLYKEVYEEVKENFKEYHNVQIIRGSVPSSLKTVSIEKVAFLALDMNNTQPEVAALKYFWPRMVSGAICLMDDYAYVGYHPQKKALDEVASELGVEILSLPTGQGLLIKP